MRYQLTVAFPVVILAEKWPETTAQGPDVTSNIPLIEVDVGKEAVKEAAPDPVIFA